MTDQEKRGISVFKGIPEYFSDFFQFLGDLSWLLALVTLPEWVSGADVGLAVLPGYTTVTGADLSAV